MQGRPLVTARVLPRLLGASGIRRDPLSAGNAGEFKNSPGWAIKVGGRASDRPVRAENEAAAEKAESDRDARHGARAQSADSAFRRGRGDYVTGPILSQERGRGNGRRDGRTVTDPSSAPDKPRHNSAVVTSKNFAALVVVLRRDRGMLLAGILPLAAS